MSALNTPELIAKYIKYLDFNKSLSHHSIRAYSNDLLQVFQIKKTGVLKGPKLDRSPSYSWESNKGQVISESYDHWKDIVQKSMSKWGKLSQRSRRRKLSSLSGFIQWMESEEKIKFPLILPISKPPHKKIPHFLSVDECLSIISYLEKSKDTHEKQQQELLFYLLYGCGLRISEACKIETEHISIRQKYIRIMGKGSKERMAVLPKKLIEILDKYYDASNKYLFGDKPLPTRTGYERIRQLGKACGLMKPLHPHALRHSYATQLLGSGSDLRVLQQLMGHQSLSATELYTHLDINQLARSLENHHPLSKK